MKNALIKDYALLLDGLKAFETNNLISYDFELKKAFVDSKVFDPLLKMVNLDYKKLAKAAAVKIFLENSKGKKHDDVYFDTEEIKCSIFCNHKGFICEEIIK